MVFVQSEVDVMNLALRRVGQDPITLAESNAPTSKNSKVVAAFFEGTVREILRIMPWNCAVMRAALTPVSNTDTSFLFRCSLSAVLPYPQWAASTAYVRGDIVANSSSNLYVCTTAGTSAASPAPTGTTANAIITDGGVSWVFIGPQTTTIIRTLEINGNPDIPYRVEGSYLYCSEATIRLRYIGRPAAASWDALLTDAIASRLASKIAVVLAGDAQLAQLMYQEFTLDLAVAKQVSAVEDRSDIVDLFGLYQNAQLAVRANTVQG